MDISLMEENVKRTENLRRIMEIWPEILAALAESYEASRPQEDRVNQHIGAAFSTWFAQAAEQPETLYQQQLTWWQQSGGIWQAQWQKFLDGQTGEQPVADRRFRHDLWSQNPYFDSLRQFYLHSAAWVEQTVEKTSGGLEEQQARLVRFYTRQWLDALAPSNFLLTNPEALQATLNSDGETLLRGMRNFQQDVKAGRIRMAPENAFIFGENIAASPGAVVYENRLMQLLQYAPVTPKVRQIPLLIMPAWINKFYILDLQQQNSLVKWLVEQGFTVFVISWANPDESHRDIGFGDYLTLGPLAAMDAIARETGEAQVNIMGYCLGGTLLTCLLAWLAARGESARVKSASFLTTLIDFRDAGDMGVFIDETQLGALEEKMEAQGYLPGRDMATTFNLLRPKDLIWSFFINNYLLGKEPYPFDLLFWNADATRMPAKMHSYYLRQMYQHNQLIIPGALTIAGEAMDVSAIQTPSYFLATREDHIAPWTSVYRARDYFKGPLRFVLAASGHVAGVINPPGRGKYGHWVNEALPASPAQWIEAAREQSESWWVDWAQWAEKHSGGWVKKRKPGAVLGVIEPAPGRYIDAMTEETV